MSLISVYNVGTVSVVAGSTQVTGSSTGWVGAGVREGDYLWVAGFVVRIASCEGGQALTLAYPWPSMTMENVNYEIQYTPDVERTLGSAQNVLATLRSGSFGALATVNPSTDTMPYYTGYNTADVTSLTPFGRQVIASTDRDGLQTLLDLVSQSGDLDNTLNRVMKVGAFGLGTTAAPLIANIDSFEAAAGFYKVDARITQGVLPPSSNVADGLIILHPTASQTMQVYLGMTELGRNFIRKSNSDGTWAPWRSIMLDFEFGAGPGSGLDADTVDGYEASAFIKAADFTSDGMLAYIKQVDGSGSGLDADLLDGQHGEYYCNADNLNAGIVPSARLSGDYNISNLTTTNSVKTQLVNIINSADSTKHIKLTQLNSSGVLQFEYVNGASSVPVIISNIGEPANNQDAANKAYVDSAIATLVDSAPNTLNTLNELAAALGDDPDFATTITNQIGTKLNTSAYTAADVLTKLKTVDGAGSGLDADLLDGLSSSAFVKVNGNTDILGNINAYRLAASFSNASDNVAELLFQTETGTEVAQVSANRPNNSISIRNTNTGAGGGFANLTLSGSSIITFNGGKVWHEGNDGVGSGLDADLLDGQHGSFYRDASNLNTGTVPDARLGNALLKTGGTITGTLVVAYDSTITGQGNNQTSFGHLGKDNYLRGRNTTVSSTLILGNQASTLNEAVRADREINTGIGMLGGGNLTGNLTLSFDTAWGDNRYIKNASKISLNRISLTNGDTINPALEFSINDGISWVTTEGAYFIENNAIIGRIPADSGLNQSYDVVTRTSGDGRYFKRNDTTIQIGDPTISSTSSNGVEIAANGSIIVKNSASVPESTPIYRGFLGTSATFRVEANGLVRNRDNAYGGLSDERLKENITPASPQLEELMQIEIINYALKELPEKRQIGVIAQQLRMIKPGLVVEDEDGYLSVKYSVFVPILIKALQELVLRVQQLEAAQG